MADKNRAAHIGVRVKELREAQELSQQALAMKAGLSISVVTKIEQGKKPDPRMSTILALAEALGVECGAFQQVTPAMAPGGKRPGKKAK